MAAAYLFHFVKNHPFVDGNERIGLAAALSCFDRVGCHCTADDEALVDLTLRVAEGRLAKPEIAAFLRANSRRFDPDALGDAGEGSEVREGGAITRGGS